MHNPEEQARDGGDLQQEVEVENVTPSGANRPRGIISVTVSHPDLSSILSIGPWQIPGSPDSILEALETHLPEFLCDMEARIPEARRASLPPTDFWGALYSEGMVVEILVPGSGER